MSKLVLEIDPENMSQVFGAIEVLVSFADPGLYHPEEGGQHADCVWPSYLESMFEEVGTQFARKYHEHWPDEEHDFHDVVVDRKFPLFLNNRKLDGEKLAVDFAEFVSTEPTVTLIDMLKGKKAGRDCRRERNKKFKRPKPEHYVIE